MTNSDGGPNLVPAALERWENAGGTWRIAHVGAESATVELLRCDGGEVVETLVLREPHEVSWARAQRAGG